MIINDENRDYGMYCGDWTGHTKIVSGKYVLITFHTDIETQERGFHLLFTAVPISKFNLGGKLLFYCFQNF